MRYITGHQVEECLTMTEAIKFMDTAFRAFHMGTMKSPLRYVTAIPEYGMNYLLKPSWDTTSGKSALKVLTHREHPDQKSLPAIKGVVMLFDTITGDILALMDGAVVTAMRTGAVCGLATDLFAVEDAGTMAIFGCGAQAFMQVEAVLAVRNINKLYLFDLELSRMNALKDKILCKYDVEVSLENEAHNLALCDIITTSTTATKPLFQAVNLKPHVHINAIGSYRPEMQELDPQLLLNSALIVDQREACLSESGDLIKPIKDGDFDPDVIDYEIGEYLNLESKSPEIKQHATVFKSVGLAIQDYIMAEKITELAGIRDIGMELPEL